MKRTRFILALCACTAVLWGASTLLTQAQDHYIHVNLEPGSYAVGFKVFHEYDAGRMFKPAFNDDGVLSSDPAPRPMQIAVWYPAQQPDQASYMTYRDFYLLDTTVEDPTVTLTDEMVLDLDQRFEDQMIFTGPGDREKIKSFLDVSTRALPEADAMEGSFPLIIYAPREYRGVYYNTQLIEHLVSHGFIVAVTPNKDNQSASMQAALTEEVLMANVDDLRFVKGFMSHFPNVDASKVGVVGWAWGAVPAIAFAESDPNISAVVSLDGNVRFAGHRTLLEDFPGYATGTLSTPVLHLETGGGQLNAVDYTFYDGIQYADAYHVTLKDAQWFSPSTYFYLIHAKGSADPEQFDFEQLDRAHTSMIEYAQRFFAAYLAEDRRSKSWLDADPRRQGFDEGSVLKKSKEGMLLPPSAGIFASLFANRGPEAARKVWDRVKQDNPEYQIASPMDLNNLGYMLMGQGRTADAVEAFKLQVEAYPHLPNAWDSMGEGYKNNGDDELAVEAFHKSLSLNPPQFVKDNSINLLSELGVTFEEPEPYPFSGREAKRLAGLYVYTLNDQEIETHIRWEADRLVATTDGQPETFLLPRSKNTFWAMQNDQAVGMTLEFMLERRGAAHAIAITTPARTKRHSTARFRRSPFRINK